MNAVNGGRPSTHVEAKQYGQDRLLCEFYSAKWEAKGDNRTAWFPADVATAIRRMLGATGEFRQNGITHDVVATPVARGSRLHRCAKDGAQQTTPVMISQRDYEGLMQFCQENDIQKLESHERLCEDARDRDL